ncbi:CRIB domain-containing protein RIC7-like [Salvia divinorum]|uniref:CRIB domain-containing protein RIC7-like n=1 Tax=Salvia divinorum TaxID=28513 RepID=A0ABD1H4L1_SALDI
MSTKMKGIFKGIRYISQIFDDEQQTEEDMQIGLPTDVKHVAHVGYNSDDSQSWRKDLGPSTPGIAAPYDSKAGKDSGDVKWVSEDSKRAQRTKKSQEKEQGKKAAQRRSTENNPLDISAKPRRTPKDSSDAKPRRKKSEATDQSRRRKNRSCGDATADPGSDNGPAAQKLGSKLSEDDEERESRGDW